MTTINIKIVSDTVCPWCYIGKRRLEKAISLYRSTHHSSSSPTTFNITWHPFYLNPGAPIPGIDKQAYLASRFGAERLALMHDRLSAAGKQEGILFKFGGKTGNTRDSHRLIYLSGRDHGAKVQNKVVEELFRAYFEEEGDITSVETLVGAGVRAGLGEEEVRRWIGGVGDEGGAEVDEEVRAARREFVSGVPSFTIQGKYHVGGAEEPQVFLDIFEKIRAEEAEA